MATQAENNFKVSATGGAGSAGQPAQYAAGIDNAQDFYDLQTAQPMNKSGVVLPKTRNTMSSGSMDDLIPLDAPTQRPDEPGSAGAMLGAGPDSSALASTQMLAAQNNEDIARLSAHLAVYARIAESPNASNAFRNFYRYLRSQVQ